MDLYYSIDKEKLEIFNDLLSKDSYQGNHVEMDNFVTYIEEDFIFDGEEYSISIGLFDDDPPYIGPVLYKKKEGSKIYEEFFEGEKEYEILNTFTFYIGEEEINFHVYTE